VKSAIVPIDSIRIGERARQETGDLDSIVQSAKGAAGQIQSIAVCESKKGYELQKSYFLLAGFRRLTAFKEAGLTEVLVRIYPSDLSETDRKSIELMENIARLDLTWQDQVRLVKEIHQLQKQLAGREFKPDGKTKNWTQQDTATLLSRHRTGIVEDLEIAEALEQIPLLAKCKNRHEATKFIGKIQEQIIVKELASRVEVEITAGTVDEAKARIVESYWVGDFFDLVKEIPDESIDFIDCDPPYAIDFTSSAMHAQQDRDTTIRELEMESFNEVSEEDYPQFLGKLFCECNRILKNNSWMILWCSSAHEWDDYIDSFADDYGLEMCPTPAIWTKGVGHRNSAPDRRLTGGYEIFYYFRKGEAQIIRAGESNVFFFPRGSHTDRIHPTEKPVDMMKRILQTFTLPGSHVVVPFAGGGNTLIAASQASMTAVGFDLSQNYKDAFTVRVMG